MKGHGKRNNPKDINQCSHFSCLEMLDNTIGYNKLEQRVRRLAVK